VLYIERWVKRLLHNGRKRGSKTAKGWQAGLIGPVVVNCHAYCFVDGCREASVLSLCRYAMSGRRALQLELQAQWTWWDRQAVGECGLQSICRRSRPLCIALDVVATARECVQQFNLSWYTFRKRRAKNRYGELFDSFCLR